MFHRFLYLINPIKVGEVFRTQITGPAHFDPFEIFKGAKKIPKFVKVIWVLKTFNVDPNHRP
jgi:hypothetical protein